MNTVFLKSMLFAFFVGLVHYLFFNYFETSTYLSDVGGLGAFVTVFGTLYGIMTAFVVFEVWNQYNRTVEAISKEAQGIERLYRLVLYFRDDKLTMKMKEVLVKYLKLVIEGKFKMLGSGKRNQETGDIFREIAVIIRDISFDDEHDEIIFNQIVSHYGELSQIRTLRINQSLSRLPALLKAFLYVTSAIALLTFIIMPFANIYYGLYINLSLAFVLGLISQLVEDLDNPFVGHWNITPEPFERTLGRITGDTYSNSEE